MTSSSQTKRTTPAGRRAGASRTGALKPGAKRKTTAEVRAADLKKKKEKEEKEKEKKKEEEEKEKEKKEEEEREKERARKHQEHMRQVNERLAAEQAARKAKELAAAAELLPDANGIRTISLVRLEKALEVLSKKLFSHGLTYITLLYLLCFGNFTLCSVRWSLKTKEPP